MDQTCRLEWRLFTLLVATVSFLNCTVAQKSRPFFPDTTLSVQSPHPVEKKAAINRRFGFSDWAHYVPVPAHPEYQPERLIRVNFHVMNSRDSSHNFKPAEARVFLKDLLRYANADLDTNVWNWRSPDGTPVLRKGYRYVLTPQPKPDDDGFYFHYDDSLYYYVSQGAHMNNYDQKVVRKYQVGKDSILNIFLLVHQEDSIRSKTYRANRQGIALGTSLKMAGLFETKEPAQSSGGLMNHEIGHILTLQHAWMEDGCPDTPNHPNSCWCWSEQPPCRDHASDNMMDYNAYQIAMTPCQIGRVQAAFASETNPIRKCLLPVWCRPQPGQDVEIRDSVVWEGAHDLAGNLTVASGGALYVSSRISMPAGSRITVQPGGRLWLDGARLHNSCGLEWQGIWVDENNNGQKGVVYVLKPVKMENCPQSDHTRKQ